jgi:hypothetical protein
MTKPQKKSVTLLIKRVFQTGSGILRELGDCGTQLPKTIAQKFSHHLGQIDLLKPVEEFSNRMVLKNLPHNGVIAYDLTDIAKKSAKKIENITYIFDGSKRESSKGFFVHGVGFGSFLWRLRLHNNKEEFLPQIRKQILDELIPQTKSKNPIFAFDRGNDNKKLFEYLDRKQVQFIIRLRKTRKVIIKNTGEILNVEDVPEGRYDILLKEESCEQKKKPKNIRYKEYELVIYKKQKSKKHPIRLLVSRNLDPEKKLTTKKITNLYLQRWGVENSFKQIKTTLRLESIRVMTFKKFQNFVSILHFCSLLNEILLKKMKENLNFLKNISLTKLFYEYKKHLKRYSLTINSHSFMIFLKKNFPLFHQHRKKSKQHCQTSLFRFQYEKPRTLMNSRSKPTR